MTTAVAETKVPKSATQLQMGVGKADGSAELPFATHAYVCNITDLQWDYEFNFGRFHVGGCKPGEEYHLELITDRISPMDHGDKNKTAQPIGALHIAHELVRIFNSHAGDVSYMGLFVVEFGKQPTREELEEAREKLEAFCRHYVQVANEEYEQHRKPSLIPGFARWAAKRVKVDVPFVIDAASMIECPNCTTKMPNRAASCPNCGYVVNPARFKALGLDEKPKKEKAPSK